MTSIRVIQEGTFKERNVRVRFIPSIGDSIEITSYNYDKQKDELFMSGIVTRVNHHINSTNHTDEVDIWISLGE